MKRYEWFILFALGALCVITAGIGDLLRFHAMATAGDYRLMSFGFFGAAVLWLVACALRITNEERQA